MKVFLSFVTEVPMHSKSFFFSAADCDERKLKGVIYFQAIEEVYYDHLRTATSVSYRTKPQPNDPSESWPNIKLTIVALPCGWKQMYFLKWMKQVFYQR